MTIVSIGQRAELMRTVSIDDFKNFAALSGDINPIHTDQAFAATTRFRQVIAPGLLIGSFISAAIANDLPGPGSVYMSQTLNFLRPVYAGERLRIQIEVAEILREGVCRLITTAENAAGELVIEGEAVVKFPKR
jgi:3-hydroxybutyryl-CoA dehydratase